MICPKCGFSQPDDYYCAECGVNIDRYVQKKRKKRVTVGIVAALFGIAVIALAMYIDTSTGPESTRTVGRDQSSTAPKQRTATAPRMGRPAPAHRTPKPRKVARRPRTEPKTRVPRTERAEARRVSNEEIASKPRSAVAKDSDTSKSGGEKLTAIEWFIEGRELDDDSQLEANAYKKAIELDPNFAPAYYRLGAIYYRQANYDLAEEEFAKFLQLASDEERAEYDILLYYSAADVDRILGLREAEQEIAPETEEEIATEEEEGELEAEEKIAPETEEEEGEEITPESSAEAEEGVQTVIRFTAFNGQIMVPVLLNGSVAASVLLDTGSGITIISRELAQSLELQVNEGRTVKLKTITDDVRVPLAKLDSIQVGNLSKNNFFVAVADLDSIEQRRFDGILGMDFLNDYAIHIDNKNSRILLKNSRILPNPNNKQ